MPPHASSALLKSKKPQIVDGIEGSVLLHSTLEGRALYERNGFVPAGEVRQVQGLVGSSPLIELPRGVRLRPAGASDLAALIALDAEGSGLERERLIERL